MKHQPKHRGGRWCQHCGRDWLSDLNPTSGSLCPSCSANAKRRAQRDRLRRAERRADFVSRYEAGQTYREIAEAEGISYNRVKYLITDELWKRIRAKEERRTVRPITEAEARELVEAGMPGPPPREQTSGPGWPD